MTRITLAGAIFLTVIAVIPTIISQALVRDVVLLGDLTPTRDFVYVADTVDGFVRAATAEGVVGETINLGADHEISIGALAEATLRLVGRAVEVRTDPARLRPATLPIPSQPGCAISGLFQSSKRIWDSQTGLPGPPPYFGPANPSSRPVSP